MEKTKISSIQLALLFLGFLYGSTIIITPAVSTKNDAWISIILGGLAGALLIYVYISITLLNPSKNLVQILQEKLGKIPGNIISVFYIWYFIHLASLVFRNFSEFIITFTLSETPMIVILSCFALPMLYSINSGIEVIARLSELLVLIIPIITFIIALALITAHDYTAFLPILENGITPVIKAAFGVLTFPYGETVTFMMIFPHVNKKENIKKVTLITVFIFILDNLFLFYRNISVLGSELLYLSTFPNHIVALLIPQINVESLVDINLLIGGGAKITVCIYAASKALSQVLGIEDHTKFTTAIMTFSVVLSIWVYENILEMFRWASDIWPYYSIPFQIIIPLLLLILSLKNKKTKNR